MRWTKGDRASGEFRSDEASSGSFTSKDTAGGARTEKRPVGMVVHFSSHSRATEENRELVLELAEHLYPNVERIDELSESERRQWIALQGALVRAEPEDRESMRSLLKEVDEEVEAQVSNLLADAKAQDKAVQQAASQKRRERLLERVRAARRRRMELPSREAEPPSEVVHRAEPAKSREPQLLPPPPPSPTYDRLFGNQIRWALHVIRYTLQQRRLKLSNPESK
jgi:hypothetical protein